MRLAGMTFTFYQANAMRTLSRRCAKSSSKSFQTVKETKMECSICYEIKNLVKINCKHQFCKPCLKQIIKTKENDIEDDSPVPCPLCRRDVTKTKNKSVNVSLNYCKKAQIIKQKYPMMEFKRTTNIYYFPNKNKINKIKNYPNKMKFKTYQNYI